MFHHSNSPNVICLYFLPSLKWHLPTLLYDYYIWSVHVVRIRYSRISRMTLFTQFLSPQHSSMITQKEDGKNRKRDGEGGQIIKNVLNMFKYIFFIVNNIASFQWNPVDSLNYYYFINKWFRVNKKCARFVWAKRFRCWLVFVPILSM